MFRYILRRLTLMIPTLLLSVLLAFLLSEAAQTDPAEGIINSDRGGEVQHFSRESREESYRSLRHKFGLDLPVFYFSVSSLAETDTLYKIFEGNRRKNLDRLISNYGNWNEISMYYSTLKKTENSCYILKNNHPYNDTLKTINENLNSLFLQYKPEEIKSMLQTLQEETVLFPQLADNILVAKEAFIKVESAKTAYKNYIPVFHWFGFKNHFNLWLWNISHGDFGLSYSDRRPVSSILKEAIPWTLALNGIAIFLSFLLSIPLGIFTAIKKNSVYDKVITIVLFVLYSLPVFWTATLLIFFLSGGDYLNLFPSSGVTDLPADTPFLQKMPDILWHLVLPVLCMVYGSVAFISRQMRSAMLGTLKQDYIRTAEAKGLDSNTIVFKHAFRNALLPMITLFAAILPALISGSVVIESIFSIPGMGQKSFSAVQSQDYPIIIAVMVLSAFLTMFGNLIADILYVVADPRISFTSNETNANAGE